MVWLIWKELRLHWLITVCAAVLLLLPYTIPLAAFPSVTVMADFGGIAVYLSIALSYFTMALLGGHAIACERADRSSEFLAYMPVSRISIVLSKLFLPVVVLSMIWVVNLAILSTTPFGTFDTPFGTFDAAVDVVASQQPGMNVEHFPLFAAASFFAFSAAWLVSAVQSSPTFAIGAGLVVPWATAALVYWGAWLAESQVWLRGSAAVGVAVSMGLFSFVIGTAYYLRRVEP